MHVLMTGASGSLGRFIAGRLLKEGHRLTVLGRKPPDQPEAGFQAWNLSQDDVRLPVADALVHCALSHVPGKYRGGEGDDPHGFIRLNVEGTRRLFDAARAARVRHCVFLSSRAVYTDTGNWAVLTEVSETRPDTLYGQVKLAGEEALDMLSDGEYGGTVLRATGVYGIAPGMRSHKWSGLFDAFERGEAVAPRLATEVHGEDLAEAVALVLRNRPDTPFEIFNVSDLLLDRRDLLELYAGTRGLTGPLPARGEGPLGVMEVGKLKALGWAPGGKDRLQAFLRSLS